MKEYTIGGAKFVVRYTHDYKVTLHYDKTRLEFYEHGDADGAELTYNTICDVLWSVAEIVNVIVEDMKSDVSKKKQ